jgi:hypothetical protein
MYLWWNLEIVVNVPRVELDLKRLAIKVISHCG